MEYAKKKVHSFIKCHGGKSRYARQYIKVMNKSGCDIYCEFYYGGGGVHLNIPPGMFDLEYVHDADEHVYRTLLALTNGPNKVIEYLNAWPYDPIAFANAQRLIGSKDLLKHAAGYIARNRMSRGGLFDDFAKSNRERGGRMGDLNAYQNFVDDYIRDTIERLSNNKIVMFEPGCALDLIELVLMPKNRRGKYLFFLDPPYLHETRVAKSAYRKEVDRDHHVKLLKRAVATNYKYAKFYIC